MTAKLLARGNEANPKESFPDPVDHYAGCEWIAWIDKPAGQIDSIHGCLAGRDWLWKNARNARGDFRSEVLIIATVLEFCDSPPIVWNFL